ncbi:MAG: DNA repair protein RadA [Terriglobia bacterium]
MPKPKTSFVCQHCGVVVSKWMGKCPECGEWNSIVEDLLPASTKAGFPPGAGMSRPVPFLDVSIEEVPRFSTGIAEFDRVLGGGVVPGSLILIGGDPGIGKSTLLLQATQTMDLGGRSLLYVSGEESQTQIKMRGERLGLHPDHLYLMTETCLERILEAIDSISPSLIVLDSVQTTFSEKLGSSPGSISQVREIATQFLFLSKQRLIPTFLIGHITKDGSLAGPKSLEHIVDTVLYFEGEKFQSHRIIRSIKNRFGAANELGVFEMTQDGLVPVENPSKHFLAERPAGVAGSVVISCIEGTRPILVELQALVSDTSYPSARRMAAGVDPNRISLLIAMLEKRLGFHLSTSDVYVNIAGGLNVNEPAADLGIVAAIVSSYRNQGIDPEMVIFGEVGLTGEVRSTAQSNLRIRESAALGFKRCLVPNSTPQQNEGQGDLQLIPVRTVQEALEYLFP